MIILDCSAAVEMVRATPRGQGFEGLLLQGERVVTSSLFQVEVRSAFWKYVQAGLLTPDQAVGRANMALALVDEFVPIEENMAESFAEAMRLGHPVYDMLYVTLARRNATTLFTVDKKLVRLCESIGVNCAYEMTI